MSGCPCPCSTSASSPLSFLPSIPAAPRPTSVAFSSSRGPRRRSARAVVAASKDEKVEAAEKEGDPAFNPFGFVTDNASSRSAIQLPESPAQDGNVGQMLYRTEDKGREYGKSVRSGEFRWFVRETGSPDAGRGTVMFIHGAPTQSFSYRTVMAQMTNAGYHCFAPDWIGFGFSEMPQPGYGFDYKEEEFHKAFDELLGTLNITEPFYLVVQGFIVGSYGLTWALKNPSKLRKVAILNSPLTVSSPVPGVIKQLRLPLFGEFTCQNAILAERFIEAGSPYILKSEKADVYRLPYLSSGAPGFALLEAARRANFQDVLSRISTGFSSNSWEIPILLAWGESDKYLPLSIAEEFQKNNPTVVKLKTIEGAGHMPQEDWPEKVVKDVQCVNEFIRGNLYAMHDVWFDIDVMGNICTAGPSCIQFCSYLPVSTVTWYCHVRQYVEPWRRHYACSCSPRQEDPALSWWATWQSLKEQQWLNSEE